MLKQMGHMGSNTRAKMMECSALWSNTELKKKQDYKDRVEKLKSMYKRDLEKYIESLPEEERGKYAGELEAIERQSKKQPKSSSEKYRRKAQEARKEQEDDSDDDDDDDEEEDDDDEPNKTGVGMYISHHLSSYMSENDVSWEK